MTRHASPSSQVQPHLGTQFLCWQVSLSTRFESAYHCVIRRLHPEMHGTLPIRHHCNPDSDSPHTGNWSQKRVVSRTRPFQTKFTDHIRLHTIIVILQVHHCNLDLDSPHTGNWSQKRVVCRTRQFQPKFTDRTRLNTIIVLFQGLRLQTTMWFDVSIPTRKRRQPGTHKKHQHQFGLTSHRQLVPE